jgi:PadR family transcriptional regulator, regulatory protein PadR
MENLGRVTPATALVLEVLLSVDSVWGLQVVKDGEWDSTEERKGPRRRYYRLVAEARTLASEYVKVQRVKALSPASRPSPVMSEGQWCGA